MWQRFKNLYHLFISLLANIYFQFPSRNLKVIGVTGTSGKTTTAHMIHEILKTSGKKVSLVSSIKAIIGGEEYDTGFHVTTPEPYDLPRYLRKAADFGDKYFILEVSSHGLDQNRAGFITFEVGVLTSLAHEHLDYHKTFENYAKAKFKLINQSKKGIVPQTVFKESRWNVLLKKLKGRIITFGINTGDQNQRKWKLKLKIPGEYNLLNALAAASAADALGVGILSIKKSLENFSGIQGRFEEIPNNKGFRIIIDFAHKPDALENVLDAAQDELEGDGRIIVMYGCASQRDVLKRSMMGEISGRKADITMLTDEDPRNEDSMKIINEIADGCIKAGAIEQYVILSEARAQRRILRSFAYAQDDIKNNHTFFKIPNRKEAIEFIINKLAKKGDIVLLCGKGHERSINYNGVETSWSEHEAVQNALKMTNS